jgi:hypothetical protein
VLELGGMFTILKVRDHLVNDNDPGWYQHPPGTVAQSIHQEAMPQSNEMRGQVSWFSQMEEEKQPSAQKMNWMQSRPHSMQMPH